MLSMENAFKALNVVAWIVAIIVFYFSNEATSTANVSALSERVSVVETRLQQEMLGYQILQTNISMRLDNIERKVDCLLNKQLCR